MLRQALSPGIHLVFRNAKRDVSRALAVLLRQRAWRQEITTRRFVRRVRCLAADDEQIALIGHAKHAARVTGFHFAQTENLLVKIASARQLLYEKRGFDETIQR